MPFECIGCALGHLANARTLYDEARKFYGAGDRKLGDLHLLRFFGEIRQAEEQSPFPELRARIREVRKEVEAAVAGGLPLPDLSSRMEELGVEALGLLREHPELCPTCRRPEVVHE